MDIISRAGWGATPFRRARATVPIASRRYYVVHYPGAGTPPKDIKAYCKWIEKIHLNNGWAGIGYNYIISHGKIAEGAGRDVVGAHSPPRNRDGIGVNIWTSKGVPLDEDLALARVLYDQLCKDAGRQLIKTYHGEHYATDCPGPILRRWVQNGMPWPPKPTPPKPTPPKTTPPKQEEEMPLTTAEKQEIAKLAAEQVWGTPSKRSGRKGTELTVTTDRIYDRVLPQLASLAAVVDAIAAKTLTSEEVRAAAEAGAKAALDARIDDAEITLTVNQEG